MRHGGTGWRGYARRAVAVVLAGILMELGTGAWARVLDSPIRPQNSEPASTTCAQVLTHDKALAVVGDGYAGPALDEPRPGFTRCEWQGEDTNFGFTFASTSALAADAVTADEAFDTDVAAVENADRKREILAGIGVKAALVDLGNEALLLEIARADGVARMVTYKVAREKAIALARAIGEP